MVRTLTIALPDAVENTVTLSYPMMIESVMGGWIAIVPGWEQAKAIGSTQAEAIAHLQQVIEQKLSREREIPKEASQLRDQISASITHPCLQFAQALRENPLFDEVLADIETMRRSEKESGLSSVD